MEAFSYERGTPVVRYRGGEKDRQRLVFVSVKRTAAPGSETTPS